MKQPNRRRRRPGRSAAAAPARPRFVSHYEDNPPSVFDKNWHLTDPYAAYVLDRGIAPVAHDFDALELSFFAAGEALSQQHIAEADTERVAPVRRSRRQLAVA